MPVTAPSQPATPQPTGNGRAGSPPPDVAGKDATAASSRRPLLVGLAIGAAAAAIIAAAAIVLLSSGSKSSYVTQARAALAPVIQSNRELTGALESLSAGGGAARARAAMESTIGAVEAAQSTLSGLKPGSNDRRLAADAQAALRAELAWLNAAVPVLANPGSPLLSQLGALGVKAQTALEAIDSQVPGASASFPDSTKLIAYAQSQAHAASTKRALTQFSERVQALLTQSTPAYEHINQLYGQMQTAASGGTPNITLAEAEATINEVIANRTSLDSSARALEAPTAQAASVRDALVVAYDKSLANDKDIEGCLNEANSGTFAIIFEGCLRATATDSEAATTAKQSFFRLYDQLRRQIGEPAADQRF